MIEVSVNDLEIPKASTQAVKALEIMAAPEPDMRALEETIKQDPLMASTVIRYANSPLYRRPSEVTNVPMALRLLGLKCVHSAVVMATIRSTLPAESKSSQVILAHLLEISVLCKLIARQCCADSADDLEFLGLFHDVGMLVLAVNFTEPYEELLSRALAGAGPVDELERELFGLTHDAVGARVAHEFRLPAADVELLRQFHSREPLTEAVSEQDRNTCVLALAHRLRAESSTLAPGFEETIGETLPQLQAALGLSDAQLEGLRGERESLLAAGTE